MGEKSSSGTEHCCATDIEIVLAQNPRRRAIIELWAAALKPSLGDAASVGAVNQQRGLEGEPQSRLNRRRGLELPVCPPADGARLLNLAEICDEPSSQHIAQVGDDLGEFALRCPFVCEP